MEYGLIKDTTIQSIADGLRAKEIIPSTRLEDSYIDYEVYTSDNVTSETDPTPTKLITDGEIIISIPEATSLELNININRPVGNNSSGSIQIYNRAGVSLLYQSVAKSEQKTVTYENTNYLRVVCTDYGNTTCIFGVIITAYPLDASGNRIQIIRERPAVNTLTPSALVEAVNNAAPSPPASAFSITGACQNKFAFSGWNWFIENYGDKITTKDISNASSMFDSNPIERIPFIINTTDSCSLNNMFYNCGYLIELPVMPNLHLDSDIFSGCEKLVSVNNNQFIVKTSTLPLDDIFMNCKSLRSIGNMLDNIPDVAKGSSIFGLHNTFGSCYSMDELVNLPFVYSTYNDMYTFGGCFSYCHRLKKLTFRNQVVPSTETPKAATLSLTDYVGYAASSSILTLNNAGFTNETRVTDDASYQALKDNPDWWTDKVAYSRYNHTSAVETINSLPDLSGLSIRNTIKFKGASGELTDGGAISNLTAEEIAVADAKGWTVTLV